ncbi:TonB-dependent receptor [Flavobacterium aciduliphilum]|uniref:Uncharacterized protein n=1 Tax=Flavobacterium aciduliphilum TaxID=1101402 RepID=A0A328YMH9_9FLAO|nr:TonB-dependent receptor [Flavobacterium aciduliphilum]RAR75338.1 hypothetical protein CLV55_10133 [Flavobacterium aciduliphilum]
MKRNISLKIALISFFMITQLSFSQKKYDAIGTEVVNVVKSYSATISDAFKVKETPTLDDEDNAKKESIQYPIFSVPVASTFTPSKGKAANVENGKSEKYFNNYATLAFGNYGTLAADVVLTQTLDNSDYVGAMIHHLSSQGGIKNVPLKNQFSNSSIDITYGSKSKAFSWNGDLGYKRMGYNWYGLNSSLYDNLTAEAQEDLFHSINPKHIYQNISLGGKLAVNESMFKEVTLNYNHFSDSFSSSENHVVVQPKFDFDIMDVTLKTNMVLDHVSGTFQKDYFDTNSVVYGFTNFGIKPTFQWNKEDFSVNFGVGIFYSTAKDTLVTSSKNKLYVYPNITGTYKVVGDLMIAYAGAEGALKQNTYYDFVQENFFLSPTLAIAPTDQKYDVYLGLKGKLANYVGYNLRASVMNEDNKALFKNNIYDALMSDKLGYHYGNSFNIVYDNVKTVTLFGELKADFSKNISVGINGSIFSYTTRNEQQAWNLPNLKLGATCDVTLTPKWYAGSTMFYVGSRKDQMITSGIVANMEEVKLSSYFDLNAHVGYKHNKRLTFFFKGNNLANQNYERWLNYPVQGIQVLLGANYKFDF